MAGPDGTQTLQTINVPRCKICVLIVLETLCKEAIIAVDNGHFSYFRSVLAGASDRPILLTVTPKNGINKGQKQIVVLTKNSATGSTTAGLARPPGSPQTVIQGAQVPQQPPGNVQRAQQLHSASPQQQQEAKSVIHLSPRPAPVSASMAASQSPSIPQMVVRQALSTPVRSPLVPQSAPQATQLVSNSQPVVRQISQGIQQQTTQLVKSIQSPLQGSQQTPAGVQSRVVQQGMVPRVVKSPAVRPPGLPTISAPRA